MSKRVVILDPDGTQDLGLYVVVHAATGVIYEIQCAGTMCEQRSVEGYLVPVGDAPAARPLRDLFGRLFKGSPPPAGGNRWTAAALNELAALVAAIPYWARLASGSDTRLKMEFDKKRIGELTEAWVPVTTPEGEGVLLFKNSD